MHVQSDGLDRRSPSEKLRPLERECHRYRDCHSDRTVEACEKKDRDRNVERHTTHMTCSFREMEEFKVDDDRATLPLTREQAKKLT